MKTYSKLLRIGYTALFSLVCGSAMAISIDPIFTEFGSLPGATFGGSGIPNDSVAITRYSANGYNFTLGLTAHQRYDGLAPANDGAGTFYAQAGGDTDNSNPGNNNASYARWNLGYFIDVDPNLPLFGSGYSFRLYYDKNPLEGNNVTTYRTLTESQSSDNLGYGGSIGGIITWGFPEGSFDPNAEGEYDFALVLLYNGTEVARSAIEVNVNSTGAAPARVPDAGSTVALLGLAMAGIGSLGRFRK